MKAGRLLFATVLNVSLVLHAAAQAPAPSSPSPSSAPSSAPAKTFSQQELEQLVAPIALYPDELFVQVLMASTYPLEVVAAER